MRPHRHNTDPPLFLLLYVQITNRKPRKETPGNLGIEYWGQFGGYALWRRTTNKPHWEIFLKTKTRTMLTNSPEAVVAPPGLWTTPHLRAPGHFILGNSTVSCRLLPCCSGSTTGAALPLAELGRWAVEVGSAGNRLGQPGTSHTSPPTTYPPPHLSTGAIMPRLLVQS